MPRNVKKKRRLRVFLMQPVDLPSENQEEAVGRLPLTKEVAACGYECIWDISGHQEFVGD